MNDPQTFTRFATRDLSIFRLILSCPGSLYGSSGLGSIPQSHGQRWLLLCSRHGAHLLDELGLSIPVVTGSALHFQGMMQTMAH